MFAVLCYDCTGLRAYSIRHPCGGELHGCKNEADATAVCTARFPAECTALKKKLELRQKKIANYTYRAQVPIIRSSSTAHESVVAVSPSARRLPPPNVKYEIGNANRGSVKKKCAPLTSHDPFLHAFPGDLERCCSAENLGPN